MTPNLEFCPFDGTKLQGCGVDKSNAKTCPKCHLIFMARPRQENEWPILYVRVYTDAMQAASDQPQEFQQSLFS